MAASDPLNALATLVVKTGVGLGGLTLAQRELVLALAATVLVSGSAVSEPDVNLLLRRCLAEEGAFLDTDHVELRRWLVDFHVLDRDGYGRVYTAGAPAADIAGSCEQLAGVDLPAVARAARDADAALRAQRKERWQNAERDTRG